MARQRMLNPAFFTDERVVTCSAFARLLFQGLWCEADREGRLEDKPLALKMRLFPADAVDCEALLLELVRAGLVVRYQVAGKRYLQLPNFLKHQRPHHKELPSKLPGPGKQAKEATSAPTLPTEEPPSMALKPGQTGHESASDPSESESESESESVKKLAPAAEKPRLSPAKKPPDPRWKPTLTSLEHAFREATGQTYRFQGAKDGDALRRLLAAETPEEILRRWRVGLKGEGWRQTATIAQLGSKWNDLATGPPTRGAARAPVQPSTQWKPEDSEGPIRGEEVQL